MFSWSMASVMSAPRQRSAKTRTPGQPGDLQGMKIVATVITAVARRAGRCHLENSIGPEAPSRAIAWDPRWGPSPRPPPSDQRDRLDLDELIPVAEHADAEQCARRASRAEAILDHLPDARELGAIAGRDVHRR